MANTPRRSTADVARERRLAKLAAVREQVEKGTLVIRRMTEAERARYPSRPPRPTTRAR
jgi:hypothetical protein